MYSFKVESVTFVALRALTEDWVMICIRAMSFLIIHLTFVAFVFLVIEKINVKSSSEHNISFLITDRQLEMVHLRLTGQVNYTAAMSASHLKTV